MSYINCKSAGKSGTNRTTQAEISSLLRLSFPGRVITRELQLSLVQFFGSRSGAFTATRYPPFTGTYSGAIGGKGFEPGTTVTITTIQGEPGPDARGGFDIPLDGQITVSGSSCFSTGTVSKKRTSTMVGDQANLTFKMNDGSVLLLAAFPFSDPKKGTVWTHIEVEGGQCDHLYWQGVLARR